MSEERPEQILIQLGLGGVDEIKTLDNYYRPWGSNNGNNFPLNRLEYQPGSSWPVDHQWLVCHYACGIDGNFRMAALTRALHKRKQKDGEDDGGEMTARHYFRALVPKAPDKYFPGTKTIGTELVKQHTAMLRELVDGKSGHLSRLPRSFWDKTLVGADIVTVQTPSPEPASANEESVGYGERQPKTGGGSERLPDIDAARTGMGKRIAANGLKPYQVIYLEAEVDQSDNPTKIVSFGTHFRYRWRYTSSVREINIDPETGIGTLRTELKPAADESIVSPNDAFASGKLSGARLLFGYVADQDTGTQGLGDKSFARLAGRIAINHAVEEPPQDRLDPNHRFLWFNGVAADARFLLPLRILGAPKPSAVEHYVSQQGVESRPAATITYGDLQGDPGGALNGRKFYRHQPMSLGNGALTGSERFLAEDEKTCRSDQATLARWVSRPDTRFRYTLRFRDLREWEIGALLVSLQPHLLKDLAKDLPATISNLFPQPHQKSGPPGQAPLFALKLGYGRPLGFGSVTMTVKEALILGEKPHLNREAKLPEWQRRMVLAFLQIIAGKETGLVNWLKVSRYAGQPQTDYPRDKDDDKIYSYHTKIRVSHAKQRRSAPPPGAQPQNGPLRPDRRIWLGLKPGV
ncbi:hypothetical protein [uncultured Thiodictyon sp.]|uniref:hypothetical protein n=1 Tax=uncultured Thiodictyon sp. TaxID=1846217 RepID=UPI0025DB167E|nr:hypothetical protein [uncultured Thiodictyon sp.]